MLSRSGTTVHFWQQTLTEASALMTSGLLCRNEAVGAIGRYWHPKITEGSLRDVTDMAVNGGISTGYASAARSAMQAGSSKPTVAGPSGRSRMHEDMPLLKAHGTKPTSAAGSGAVLHEAKRQESFKDSLVSGQRNAAHSKSLGVDEAHGVSASKTGQIADGRNE